MFRNLSSQLAAAATGTTDKKTMSPTLRTDIYAAIDQCKSWLTGGIGGGQAGDGVSYGGLLALIQKHFPKTEMSLDAIGHAEAEVSVIIGGVTNMLLEMSKWEGMASGMAMRTWTDALGDAHARIQPGPRKEQVAKGITKGIAQNTDISLMTREFTTKIQIISSLKTLTSKLYGQGTPEARQAEATLSSKFL
ncbi:hypothetical protein C8J56DRAFT_818206 [Mycena floridula]|nr:hypothetical protein C8J56DRAFT_818206 [Mycena floridula]